MSATGVRILLIKKFLGKKKYDMLTLSLFFIVVLYSQFLNKMVIIFIYYYYLFITIYYQKFKLYLIMEQIGFNMLQITSKGFLGGQVV